MADNNEWIDDLSLWDDLPIDPEEVNAKKEFDGEETPEGKYEVTITQISIKPAKKDPKKPVLSVWFKIINGPEKNRYIFYNNLLDTSQKVGISLGFLRKLCKTQSEKDCIKYTNMRDYAALVSSVGDSLPRVYEWAIEYSKVPSKTNPDVKFTKIDVIDIFEKGNITTA